MYWVGPLAGVAAWALLMRYLRPGTPVIDPRRALRLAMRRLEVAIGTNLLPALRRMTDAFNEFHKALGRAPVK